MTSYYPDLKRYSRIPAAQFLKYKILTAGLLLAILVLSSCDEKSTIIGTELLPEADFSNILSTDTIVPRSCNYSSARIISNNQTYSYMGGLYDQYFGTTYSDFVAQLRLTQKWPGGVPTVDSVILFMSVSGVKGSLTINPALDLYEITEQLFSDTAYYSDRDPHAGLFIGSFPLGKVTKDTLTEFRVTLPNSFGEYLLRDTTKLNQESTENDFRAFFKGLFISIHDAEKSGGKGSVPTVPTLLVFNPAKNSFAIRIYYHTQSTAELYFDFIINDKSVRYNRFFHDLSTADPAKMIKHVDDSINDSIACVQSLYGLYSRITFSGLKHYKTLLPLSVNKARLVFTVNLDGTDYTAKTVPTRIYLAYASSDTTKTLVPDYYVNANFFDGSFNSTSLTYSFNLATFVQEYIEGNIAKPEVDLFLPEGEFRNAILKSNESVSTPKFTFVYTRF